MYCLSKADGSMVPVYGSGSISPLHPETESNRKLGSSDERIERTSGLICDIAAPCNTFAQAKTSVVADLSAQPLLSAAAPS